MAHVRRTLNARHQTHSVTPALPLARAPTRPWALTRAVRPARAESACRVPSATSRMMVSTARAAVAARMVQPVEIKAARPPAQTSNAMKKKERSASRVRAACRMPTAMVTGNRVFTSRAVVMRFALREKGASRKIPRHVHAPRVAVARSACKGRAVCPRMMIIHTQTQHHTQQQL